MLNQDKSDETIDSGLPSMFLLQFKALVSKRRNLGSNEPRFLLYFMAINISFSLALISVSNFLAKKGTAILVHNL